MDDIIERIKCEIDAYFCSLLIFGSLKDYLEKLNIKTYIELDIFRVEDNNSKRPDILIISSDYVIIDLKYTLKPSLKRRDM